MAMVVPTAEAITARNRDIPHCQIVFTSEVDFGTPPMEIPIVVVYNGKDHYASSRVKSETFKDSLEMIIEKLQDCVVISSTLGNSTSNVQIKQLLGKFIINVEQDVDLGKFSTSQKTLQYQNGKTLPDKKLDSSPAK